MLINPGLNFNSGTVRINALFQDASEVAVDPTTVTFRTYSPSGSQASYEYGTDAEVVKVETGVYYAEISPDAAGRWYYRWETTSPVIADEGDFIVQRSPFFDGMQDAYRLP